MTCNKTCQGQTLSAVSIDAITATRAGMCGSCRWMPKDAGVATPCVFTCDGRPLLRVIVDPAAKCNFGRWPDASGFVHWAWRRWLGVPDLHRWVLLFKLGREPKVPGCGCDAWLLERAPWLAPLLIWSPRARVGLSRMLARRRTAKKPW